MENILKKIGPILLIFLFLLLCFSSKWFNPLIELDNVEDSDNTIQDSETNDIKYSYSNNVDVSNITESDLRKVIDKELFLLLGEKNFRDLSNQEKLRMLIKIYIENGGENAITNSPFDVSDLKQIHENSTLNNLNITYENINDFDKGGLVEYNQIGYVYYRGNQTYRNLNTDDNLNIITYPKLVNFKNESNKYLVSYNYLFSTSYDDNSGEIALYKNINDVIEMRNEIKRITSVDFTEYLSTNNEYEKYKDELDTYNYIFEVVDNKLTLVDFYLSNNKISCSYNSEIDLQNITQEDLEEIINDDLFLLVKTDKISNFSNQDKLLTLYKFINSDKMCNYDTYDYGYISIDDFKKMHSNSPLNGLKIEYNDINDFYSRGFYNSNDFIYKVDNFTNRYVYVGMGHGGGIAINIHKKLINYKQDGNKYYLSYKYLFAKSDDEYGPANINLYKNIDDTLKDTNKIKIFAIKDNDFEAQEQEIKLYLDENFDILTDDLYTYNYVFEVIDNKLTLTDYYRK